MYKLEDFVVFGNEKLRLLDSRKMEFWLEEGWRGAGGGWGVELGKECVRYGGHLVLSGGVESREGGGEGGKEGKDGRDGKDGKDSKDGKDGKDGKERWGGNYGVLCSHKLVLVSKEDKSQVFLIDDNFYFMIFMILIIFLFFYFFSPLFLF